MGISIRSSQRYLDLMRQYIHGVPCITGTYKILVLLISFPNDHPWKGQPTTSLSAPIFYIFYAANFTLFSYATLFFPTYASGPLNKPAVPASKYYLLSSKLITHPLNSRLTTTSSKKCFGIFQIKWVIFLLGPQRTWDVLTCSSCQSLKITFRVFPH